MSRHVQVTFHVTVKLFLLLVSSVTLSNGKTGLKLSNCSCLMSGQHYNLKSLARLDGRPRFQREKNNWNYAYNPCIPFSIEPPCEDVAVCYWDVNRQRVEVLGLQKDMQCQSSNGRVEFIFSIPDRKPWITTIILKCNQTRKGVNDGNFSIIEDTSNPVLQLEHKCCCPDACSDDGPTVTPAPHSVPYQKTYDIVGEVLGGSLGFLLIVVGITFYCRRRNRRDEQNRPLIIDQPRYRAVGSRDPGIEAPAPDDDASDNDDDASDNDVDGSDNDVDASDNDDDASDNDVDGSDNDDDASDNDVDGSDNDVDASDNDDDASDNDVDGSDNDDDASDNDDDASDNDVDGSDNDVDASDNEVEAPNADDEAPVPDIGAPDPEDEAGEPSSVASDPDVGVPVPEVSSPDHVSVSVYAYSNSRGESPHIADVIPRISDEDLSHPIAEQSNPENQCCEGEPFEPVHSPREPVEHSLEQSL